jgi:L-threonylcarbamoyladenylate synthase
MKLPGDDPSAVAQAAQRLAAGELVAFPTETVYGLGARADDDAAVARIYAAKGRPSGHPLIVHVAGVDGAARFADVPGPLAESLMARFWPGPLTVIVRRAAGVAGAAAGGHPTIGLRCPSHPVAHALLEAAAALGVPGVAAPSANRFGRVSPTTADHVVSEFGDALPVLDGGACPVGIESTIVDCSRERPVLLRPGTLARDDIEAALGQRLRAPDDDAPQAPGTLAAHYAPAARVRLMSAPMLRDALAVIGADARGVAVYSRTVRPVGRATVHRTMPDDARAAAFELFAVMRELDALGVKLIWVEQPPDTPDWDGVRDRLQRAAAA